MNLKYKTEQEILDIFTDDTKYCVVGYGIYQNVDKLLCEFVAHQLFFEQKSVLWVTPHVNIDTGIIEEIKKELKQYGIGIGNTDIIITNREDFQNIELNEKGYDYFIVNNNSYLDNEKLLTSPYFKKSIITTLDYTDCLFYKCEQNKYILENNDIEEHLKKLEKERKTPHLIKAVEAKFDDYQNFFENK